jgi:hypothetical protein
LIRAPAFGTLDDVEVAEFAFGVAEPFAVAVVVAVDPLVCCRLSIKASVNDF